jgi:hypothetical protein
MMIESARLTGHDRFILGDTQGSLVTKDSAKAEYDRLMVERGQARRANDLAKVKTLDDRIAALGPVAFG